MRIGIDGRLWGQTGVGRYIRNLVIELQKIDNKNEYVLFARSEDLESIQNSKFKIQNSRWKIIESNIKWHTISEQVNFASVLNKEQLDLVHFPYFSVSIFYKRPFVVTIHDLIINHFPTGKASTLILPIYKIKLFAYRAIIKRAARKAKKIITVSNATKAEIIDHLKIKKDKIAVVYNGIDENFLKTSRQKRLIKEPYFLYVGNAYPHKNLERLLIAFSKFSKENKDTKLVLVGKEDYFYKKLKEKVTGLRLENSVIFYQEASDKTLSNLYEDALALVMPSLMEGFGLPVVEAMVSKCLVLASDIPSLREICQESAIYFNPTDVNDIAKHMQLAIDKSELREKLVEEGFNRGLNFSWEKSAKETLRVYTSAGSV